MGTGGRVDQKEDWENREEGTEWEAQEREAERRDVWTRQN